MSAISLAILIFTCAAGSLVQATTGFGYGIVCMAVFPYILGYSESIAICSLCAATMSSMVAVRNYKKVKPGLILPMLAGFSVASVMSIRFVKNRADGTMTKALGVILILVSIYFILFSGKIRIRPTLLNGVIAGALGGTGAGMFGIGGPPVVIFLMSATDDKDIYRSCSLAYFAVGSWYASGVRLLNGIITARVVTLWLIAVLAIAAGTWLGNRLFDRVDAKKLKYLVYGFMAVSGAAMLF